MAKKSFKSGLGSLIQNSSIAFEDNGFLKDGGQIERLKFRIQQLQEELMLWRTGKLDIDIFEKSLKDNHLRYNQYNNTFEKAE
jgi:hypothetical protein